MNASKFALLSSIVLATRSAAQFMFAETGDELNELISENLVQTNPAMVQGTKIAARATEQGMAAFDAGNDDGEKVIQGFGSADQAGGFGSGFGETTATASAAQTTAPVASVNPAAANVGTAENTSAFKIVGGFVPPAKPKRSAPVGGAAQEKYPFASLKAPRSASDVDAFFVAATEKMPDPVKSLTSAVSAANRRYATVTGEKTNAQGKKSKIYEYNVKFDVFPGTADNTPNGQKGAWVARVK